MLDYDCPYCGKRMIQHSIKPPHISLEGLPKDENTLMEVVEYYDIGYGLHPTELHYWVCEHCVTIKSRQYCSFVMFKNGEVYGWTGDGWKKLKITEKVDFT